MQIFDIDKYHVDTNQIYQISELLKEGAIFVFPTDSVYALGCLLSNKEGIDRMLKITGKKEKHSKLSIICKSIKDISQFTLPFNNHVFKTMNRYLPGPYTFILKADKSVKKFFDNNKSEIGVRIPDHPVMTALFKYIDEPIIATSLNKDNDPITNFYINPVNIAKEFEHQIDILIDTGIGKPTVSTVLDCTGDEIELIRQGEGMVD